MRILLVDDCEIDRHAISRWVVSGGHEIHGVGSASEGLQELTKQNFDLILCDIFLPDSVVPEPNKETAVVEIFRSKGVPLIAISGASSAMNSFVGKEKSEIMGALANFEKREH